jgi:hypothetical protein
LNFAPWLFPFHFLFTKGDGSTAVARKQTIIPISKTLCVSEHLSGTQLPLTVLVHQIVQNAITSILLRSPVYTEGTGMQTESLTTVQNPKTMSGPASQS